MTLHLRTVVSALVFSISLFFFPSQLVAQGAAEKLSNYSLGVEAYQQGEFRRAFDAWSLGSYEGDSESQYNLGVLYLEGKGAEQNTEQARTWFIEAAGKGHVEAQYNLGHMSLSGLGVEKDVPAALMWWKLAAEGGYAQAQFNYGRALYLGIEGHEDKFGGLELIRLAAEQKDKRAQAFLSNNTEEITQLEEPAKDEPSAVVIATLDEPRNEPLSELLPEVEIEPVEADLPASELGEVKLQIVRDKRTVQHGYFIRSVDQPVTMYAHADFAVPLGQLSAGTMLKVTKIEEAKIQVIPATGFSGSVVGWIGARSLAYSGETSQQLRDAWIAQRQAVNKPEDVPAALPDEAPADVTKPLPVEQVTKPVPHEVDNNLWLFTQTSGARVIHLFTLLDFDKALEISREPLYSGKAHVYTTQVRQQQWTFLLLGPYEDNAAAENARKALPTHYAKHARVRSLALIAQNRCAKREQLTVRQSDGLDAYCL